MKSRKDEHWSGLSQDVMTTAFRQDAENLAVDPLRIEHRSAVLTTNAKVC
ncbi:hypothetical protein [Bacillus stercoris]|nr:hypothetical protein [Bacillus stercoris]